MREQLGAVEDGDAFRPRGGNVRHLLLDRGGQNQRRAVFGETAAILGQHRDAETLELAAELAALATVEGTIAAAGPAANHHLELRERAHARAAEARVMEAARTLRIRNGQRGRFGDQHVVAFAHAREEIAHIAVGHAHAAMGVGAAEQALVVGAVQIDVALQRIAPSPTVHALL